MDHGYTSVIELCSALPHVVRMERPHTKGGWKLFDKRLPSPIKPGSESEDHLYVLVVKSDNCPDVLNI